MAIVISYMRYLLRFDSKLYILLPLGLDSAARGTGGITQWQNAGFLITGNLVNWNPSQAKDLFRSF